MGWHNIWVINLWYSEIDWLGSEKYLVLLICILGWHTNLFESTYLILANATCR